MSRGERTVKLRFAVLLGLSFLAIGAIATFSVARVALQRDTTDYQSHLLDLARLVSTQVDPSGLSSGKFGPGPGSNNDSVVRSLQRARRTISGLHAVDLLLKGPVGIRSLSVGPATGSTTTPTYQDSQWTRSLALVQTAFSTGQPVVETSVRNDLTGPSIVAFAPVVASNGQVAAVLALTQDAREFTTRASQIVNGAWTGLVIVAILGIVIACALVGYVSLGQQELKVLTVPLQRPTMFRRALGELLILSFAGFVIAVGVYGFMSEQAVQKEAARSMVRVRSLESVRSQLVADLLLPKIDPLETQQLKRLATDAGVDWSPSGAVAQPADLAQLSRQSESQFEAESGDANALQDMASAKETALLLVFAIAAFLSMAATVLLRNFVRQQGDLLEARESAAKQRVAYQNVADNLPIGFYTYRDGLFETTNVAWDRLTARASEEDRREAFVRALHPEDRDRVLETLERAEREHTPFGIAYRLISSEGVVRHVETRGVALSGENGDPNHMVGFVLDISSRVRAQRLLEEKNRDVQVTNDMLRRALGEIEENFEAMVHSLVKAVEAKDPYTAGHSERVMGYSLKIGERLGLSAQEMRVLKMGTLVHDLGKIGIPDAILTKPARLTDEEYALIKMHPELGFRMIEGIPTFAECVPIVLHHHERLDGKGYPHGLKGLEIPLLVRITAVSDCFDAMTSNRAYRKGMDPSVAIAELFHSADLKGVDRHVVEVLAEVIEEEGMIEIPGMSATVA